VMVKWKTDSVSIRLFEWMLKDRNSDKDTCFGMIRSGH
jgi:hypothetical protein